MSNVRDKILLWECKGRANPSLNIHGQQPLKSHESRENKPKTKQKQTLKVQIQDRGIEMKDAKQAVERVYAKNAEAFKEAMESKVEFPFYLSQQDLGKVSKQTRSRKEERQAPNHDESSQEISYEKQFLRIRGNVGTRKQVRDSSTYRKSEANSSYDWKVSPPEPSEEVRKDPPTKEDSSGLKSVAEDKRATIRFVSENSQLSYSSSSASLQCSSYRDLDVQERTQKLISALFGPLEKSQKVNDSSFSRKEGPMPQLDNLRAIQRGLTGPPKVPHMLVATDRSNQNKIRVRPKIADRGVPRKH